MDTCNKALADDWNAVAFNLGSLSGGALVGGAGGGRYIANKVSPEPSTVPRSLNPFTTDRGYGFVRHPELPIVVEVWNYLGTGPTPSSWGGSAMGVSSGLSLFLQSAAVTYPIVQEGWISSFGLHFAKPVPECKKA